MILSYRNKFNPILLDPVAAPRFAARALARRSAPERFKIGVTEAPVAEIAGYARRNGAGFMLVSVPYAIQVHPQREVREALQKRLEVPDLFYPDRRLAALAAAGGFEALPLAPEMQRMAERSGAFFHGFGAAGLGRGHWNADGHRAAADLIARRLCAQPRTHTVGGRS